jgi:hypothetical protein
MKKLIAESRCFNCLRAGHSSKECKRRSYSCILCNGQHNTALCTQPNSNSSKMKRPDTPKTAVGVNTIVAATSDGSAVALMTVSVPAQKLDGTEEVVTVFLDPGSQLSLLTEAAALRVGTTLLLLVPWTSIRSAVRSRCDSPLGPGH